MEKTFSFNKNYFLATLLLFLIEVGIALFVKDRFIRPYFGDFLVVILLYCFLKSFWNETPLKAGVYVLVFAFAIEIGQYFQLVKLIGLNHSELARTVIGTGFDWGDLVAYTLGILLVLILEKYIFGKQLKLSERK
ncbi:MAG: DUF2809 domain-containing protein [Saprospiraceae bacterium]